MCKLSLSSISIGIITSSRGYELEFNEAHCSFIYELRRDYNKIVKKKKKKRHKSYLFTTTMYVYTYI